MKKLELSIYVIKNPVLNQASYNLNNYWAVLYRVSIVTGLFSLHFFLENTPLIEIHVLRTQVEVYILHTMGCCKGSIVLEYCVRRKPTKRLNTSQFNLFRVNAIYVQKWKHRATVMKPVTESRLFDTWSTRCIIPASKRKHSKTLWFKNPSAGFSLCHSWWGLGHKQFSGQLDWTESQRTAQSVQTVEAEPVLWWKLLVRNLGYSRQLTIFLLSLIARWVPK